MGVGGVSHFLSLFVNTYPISPDSLGHDGLERRDLTSVKVVIRSCHIFVVVKVREVVQRWGHGVIGGEGKWSNLFNWKYFLFVPH